MGQLEQMQVFIRVVEAGGISKAADQLNIAKSAVSRHLSLLEDRLGTRLIERTTRQSNLTEAGQQYYQRALKLLDEVSAMADEINDTETELKGNLRFALPLSAGLLHFTPIIEQFASLHPKLQLDVDFADRQVDLVAEGFELAFRIGKLQDSSYRARKLTVIRHVICASPDYLEQHGTPTTLEALTEHPILQYGNAHRHTLPITTPDGKHKTASFIAKLRANNGDFLKAMAIAGHGPVHLPTFLVYDALADGRLVQLLADHKLEPAHAWAIYPQNRFLSKKARALIDFIAGAVGEEPYWDQSIRS